MLRVSSPGGRELRQGHPKCRGVSLPRSATMSSLYDMSPGWGGLGELGKIRMSWKRPYHGRFHQVIGGDNRIPPCSAVSTSHLASVRVSRYSRQRPRSLPRVYYYRFACRRWPQSLSPFAVTAAASTPNNYSASSVLFAITEVALCLTSTAPWSHLFRAAGPRTSHWTVSDSPAVLSPQGPETGHRVAIIEEKRRLE